MIGSMLRRAQLSGDGATLSLDFTQMATLSDLTSMGLTFSRSTSGTRINASGYVETVSSGNPRFDYDLSGNALGILIEGASTNLLCHNTSFSKTPVGAEQVWADSASVSRVTDTGPDNVASSAVNFVAIGTPGTVIASAAVGTSAQRTLSFWARRSGGGSVEYTLDNGSTWTAVTITASWARYIIAATTANQRVGFRVATGSGTSIWGVQLEAGSGASSLIFTTSGTATRNSDSCVMTGTNFSSWFAGATEGVFFSEYEAPRSLGSADYFCLGTQYAAGNFIGLSLNNANRYPQASISPGGGFRISGPITTTATTPMKHAAKWSGVNNILVIANGVVGSTHAATTGTPSLTMFSIGSSSSSGTAATGDYLNACVRRVKFWPTALSNAQIIALTT